MIIGNKLNSLFSYIAIYSENVKIFWQWLFATTFIGNSGCTELRFRTAKNQDVSTGPLARSLTALTHLLVSHCSLCSRAPLRSLAR